jgi:nucleoside-diphosphate-sugar epimerase
MKKILVTGANGYLGSVLVPYLRNKNRTYSVLPLDIGFFNKCTLYKKEKEKNEQVIYKDVRDISVADLKKVDAIVHLAGISNDPLNKISPDLIYNPTREYTLRLAKLAKSLNIRFIFASSCSVYGAANTKSLLDEHSSTNPKTGYSLNKLQIEKDLEKIADKNFFPICLRFATIFGMSKYIRFDLVINMLVAMALINKKIILNSNGRAWRPNLYIEDACSAIDSALKYKKNKKDKKILILNVGRNDNNLKIIDIAKKIKNLIKGSKIFFLDKNGNSNLIADRKIKKGKDNRTYKVSFNKIKKKFINYNCKYTVEHGIKKIINDLKKIKLTEKIFYNKKFYRLQYLEYLYQKKKINSSLKWKI